MRERIAIMVCVLTLVAAVACSLIFSVRHNASEDAPLNMSGRREMNRPAPGETNIVLAARTNATEPAPTNMVESAVQSESHGAAVRGREIYEANRCSGCHSIAGTGNPRSPLDGVGARRTKEDLVDWITGTGTAAESLPSGVVRRKQRYSDLPPGDLTALVEYLSTLKNGAAAKNDGSSVNQQNVK